jgi:hypothetical protein
MNPSVSAYAPPANPLLIAGHEVAAATPVAAWQVPSFAIEECPMEDGGVALALDLCDGRDPWQAWKEWVDTSR